MQESYRICELLQYRASTFVDTSEDIIIQFHFDHFTFMNVWHRRDYHTRTICSLLFFPFLFRSFFFNSSEIFSLLLSNCSIPFLVFFFSPKRVQILSFLVPWHSANFACCPRRSVDGVFFLALSLHICFSI